MRTLIFSAAALVTLVLSGCGGSSVDCNAMCQKSVECNSSQTLDECMKSCATYSEILDDSYADALSSCSAGTCAELPACSENAAKQCSGDPTPLFDDYCAKISSCEPSITEDACKAQFASAPSSESFQFMKCISSGTISSIGSCIQSSSCDTLNESMQKCVEKVVGTFGTSDAQPGDN